MARRGWGTASGQTEREERDAMKTVMAVWIAFNMLLAAALILALVTRWAFTARRATDRSESSTEHVGGAMYRQNAQQEGV